MIQLIITLLPLIPPVLERRLDDAVYREAAVHGQVDLGTTRTGSYQTGSYQKGRFSPPKPKRLHF